MTKPHRGAILGRGNRSILYCAPLGLVVVIANSPRPLAWADMGPPLRGSPDARLVCNDESSSRGDADRPAVVAHQSGLRRDRPDGGPVYLVAVVAHQSGLRRDEPDRWADVGRAEAGGTDLQRPPEIGGCKFGTKDRGMSQPARWHASAPCDKSRNLQTKC